MGITCTVGAVRKHNKQTCQETLVRRLTQGKERKEYEGSKAQRQKGAKDNFGSSHLKINYYDRLY